MEQKLLDKLLSLDLYLTFECDLSPEEYSEVAKRILALKKDILSMRIVTRSLPTNKKIYFRDWLDINCNYLGGANWIYKEKNYFLNPK